MSSEHRDQPELSPDEREFVDGLERAFAPRPLSAARRAALDQRVRERIERPRGLGLGLAAPAWGAAAVAALAAIWLALPTGQPVLEPGPTVARVDVDVDVTTEAAADEAWEQRLFYGDPTDDTLTDDESGLALPPDYAAIDSVFFDG